jgi:hypothetical protein
VPKVGRAAKVKSIGYYHGGDVLYQLEGVPGIWQEQCGPGPRNFVLSVSRS